MTIFIIVCCLLGASFVWYLYEEDFLKPILTALGMVGGVLALLLLGVKSCTESEWYAKEKAADAAACQAAAVPRVINEVDNCKTYAFKPTCSGEWKYFVRCPGAAETSTDNSYTVHSGKTLRRVEDSIEVKPQ